MSHGYRTNPPGPELRRPARRVDSDTTADPVPGESAPLDVQALTLLSPLRRMVPKSMPMGGERRSLQTRVKGPKEPPPQPTLVDFPKRMRSGRKVCAPVSTAGGVKKSVSNAANLGRAIQHRSRKRPATVDDLAFHRAIALALPVKYNRKWESLPLEETAVEKLRSEAKELQYDLAVVLPHSSHLVDMVVRNKCVHIYLRTLHDVEGRRCQLEQRVLCMI